MVYLIGTKIDNIPFKGREQIDVVKQILITIYVLATPDSFRSISERFNVSKSTAWFSTKRVVRAIYGTRNQYIKWPTYEEAENTWTNIKTLYRFPKVLGVIDGTYKHSSAERRCQ